MRPSELQVPMRPGQSTLARGAGAARPRRSCPQGLSYGLRNGPLQYRPDRQEPPALGTPQQQAPYVAPRQTGAGLLLLAPHAQSRVPSPPTGHEFLGLSVLENRYGLLYLVVEDSEGRRRCSGVSGNLEDELQCFICLGCRGPRRTPKQVGGRLAQATTPAAAARQPAAQRAACSPAATRFFLAMPLPMVPAMATSRAQGTLALLF